MSEILSNFRTKYPNYDDVSDIDLGNMLAKKYPNAYGDLAVQEDREQEA